jgi:F-type H+-transporting ATPase subunit epsilon
MLRLEIVTVEGTEFDEDVNMVIAPGSEGVLGILPRHTPLITTLTYGELQIKKEGQPDQFFAIGGGFMEIRPYHVIVMADSAERAEEIDIDRAKAARQRAEDLLSRTDEQVDFSRAEAALRRSAARLKVAQRRGYARDRHRPPSDLG